MRQFNRQRGVQITLTALRYVRAQLPMLHQKMALLEKAKRVAGKQGDPLKLLRSKKQREYLEHLEQKPNANDRRIGQMMTELAQEIAAFKSAIGLYEAAQIEHLAIRADIRRWKNELYHRVMQFYRDKKAISQSEVERFFPGIEGDLKLTGSKVKLLEKARSLCEQLTETEAEIKATIEEAMQKLQDVLNAREEARRNEDRLKAMREQALERAHLFYNGLYDRLIRIYPTAVDYVETCFYDLPRQERKAKKGAPKSKVDESIDEDSEPQTDPEASEP